jgi:hypothetical protein
MNSRERIVLSPYQLPTQNALMIANDDIAAIMNGYAALWHPAAVVDAAGPPRLGSPYDFERPVEGHLYAVPETLPLLLPDDWDQRVRDAGAIAFRSTPDRETTLANLRAALAAIEDAALLDLPADAVGPFLGIGFGYLMVDGLFEAMEHEKLLAKVEFWQDVQQAAAALKGPNRDVVRQHLQAAAERLLAAREVLYPVNIHLLDLVLFDPELRNETLPGSFHRGLALNLVASASLLERFSVQNPEGFATLRDRVAGDLVEICGGSYVEREDALLPVESQLWNLKTGMAAYQRLLGQEIRTFARRRFGAHPQLPLFLNSVGLHRALLLTFDDSTIPTHRSTLINWPSPDGKQVEAFTRAPYPADNPQTFFHVAHNLHKTIMQDHAATFALLHKSGPAQPWYDDWLELARLAPVLGQWTTLSRYLTDVLAGEYTTAAAADDFHGDYLSERVNAHHPEPVSGFARHVRWRRRLDTAFTLAAMARGLMGKQDSLGVEPRLTELEARLERDAAAPPRGDDASERELNDVQKAIGDALAGRLLGSASQEAPGYLLLNPCSFARRLALELDGFQNPLPVAGAVKAFQLDGDKGRMVVETPALGFTWIPARGQPGTPMPPARMRLADARSLRNEFLEAEIDPATGGLRTIRDQRTRVGRLGQQLVYHPGSTMRAREVRVTSTGPALGEIISEGDILDEQQQVLATFRQRFRAWLGRPVLDLRIEVFPRQPPQGYPWYMYYGARFAWRDERATLVRGVNGAGFATSYTRPETPDYLELTHGGQRTTIFPGGLPFHQRNGTRMLDVILIPEGETATAFDLAIGLDRENPMQTAVGMVTPPVLVPTTRAPAPERATGWLFHLDRSNLVLTRMWPAADGADAVVARMLECSGHTGPAEFHGPRNPQQATLLDARGEMLLDVQCEGDAALFEVTGGDLVQLSMRFS